MKLIYTTHARHRMAQRRVSEMDIAWVLSNPDEVEEYNGEAMAVRNGSERVLKVIYYKMTDDAYRIITVIAQRVRARGRGYEN